MSSCSILNVCFKTKKLLKTTPQYKAYTWSCLACGNKHKYDSRKDTNVKSVAIDFGDKEYRICPTCVKEMNKIMEED